MYLPCMNERPESPTPTFFTYSQKPHRTCSQPPAANKWPPYCSVVYNCYRIVASVYNCYRSPFSNPEVKTTLRFPRRSVSRKPASSGGRLPSDCPHDSISKRTRIQVSPPMARVQARERQSVHAMHPAMQPELRTIGGATGSLQTCRPAGSQVCEKTIGCQ